MQIFVKTSTGETITLEADRCDTISNIMSKIVNEACVMFNGKRLKDNRTISDCNIKDASTIDLVPRVIDLFVVTTLGKKITLEVQSSKTILNVKEMIHELEGVEVDMQELMFAEEELENKHTLAHYGVKKRDILVLQVVAGRSLDGSIQSARRKLPLMPDLEAEAANGAVGNCRDNNPNGRSWFGWFFKVTSDLVLSPIRSWIRSVKAKIHYFLRCFIDSIRSFGALTLSTMSRPRSYILQA